MTRHSATAILAVLLACPLWAAAGDWDFDQGVDAKGFAALARADASQGRSPSAPEPAPCAVVREWTKDCGAVSLGPGDSASQPVNLLTGELVALCFRTGRRGEPEDCRRAKYDERPRIPVRVVIDGRKPLLPWERDAFHVCRIGEEVGGAPYEAAYRYTQTRVEGGDVHFVPGEKIPMEPDPRGLDAILSSGNGKLEMTIKDNWAAYYRGDKTVIKVSLVHAVPRGRVLHKMELVPEPGQDTIVYDFAKAKGLRLSPGEAYYVEWGFQRIGSVSTPTYLGYRSTNRAVYDPGGASASR